MTNCSYSKEIDHIFQKYRLAVSLAVLKSKPPENSIEEHITTLRNNIRMEDMDIDDLNITVSSGDFHFDDDDSIIIATDDKNGDSNKPEDTNIVTSGHHSVLHKVDNSNKPKVDTNNDRNQNINENIVIDNVSLNESVTILQDFEENIGAADKEANEELGNDLTDVLNVLKDVDPDYLDQSTYCDNSQINNPKDPIENLNFNQCCPNTDYSQGNYNINNRIGDIICKNINKNVEEACRINKFSINVKNAIETAETSINKNYLTDIETVKHNSKQNVETYIETTDLIKKNDIIPPKTNSRNYVNTTFDMDSQDTIIYNLQGFTQFNTHVSQSQNDIVTVNKMFIHGTDSRVKEHVESESRKTLCKKLNTYNNSNEHIVDNGKNNVNSDTTGDTNEISNKLSKLSKTVTTTDAIKGTLNFETPAANTMISDDNATEIKYVIDKNGRVFKISAGGCSLATNGPEIFLQNNKIEGHAQVKAYNKINIKHLESAEHSYQINSKQNENAKSNQDSRPQYRNTQSTEIESLTKESSQEFNLSKTKAAPNKEFSQISEKILSQDDNPDFRDLEPISIVNNTQNTLDDSDQEMATDELVPFKVMEELNKVKYFLNRRDKTSEGYVTDSGYRSSDSQSRSSYWNSQLGSQDNWLNQSAHCLYYFLTHCPLVGPTGDVLSEISKILGLLVDRLHDDEKYPSFLDDMLEKVDALLMELYEGDNTIGNVLQKRDENTQRLLLLNRSRHITEYTLDKIIAILEKTHINLTQQEIYEITETNQIENLPYVFHLLEYVIKKYLKYKKVKTSSQSDEKILKKSSITEIWRKKWQASAETCKNEVQSVCYLTKCADVLKKLVVDCMEGYSLIAYAALQCFNLLQS